MNVKLTENPRDWRKQAILTALGVAIVLSLLRWRHIMPHRAWVTALVALGGVGGCAFLRPRWFRGYYRLSMRAGFWLSQFIGRLLLLLLFALVVTPLGWILRLTGKDPLNLKRPRDPSTYWHPARDWGPLDRLF